MSLALVRLVSGVKWVNRDGGREFICSFVTVTFKPMQNMNRGRKGGGEGGQFSINIKHPFVWLKWKNVSCISNWMLKKMHKLSRRRKKAFLFCSNFIFEIFNFVVKYFSTLFTKDCVLTGRTNIQFFYAVGYTFKLVNSFLKLFDNKVNLKVGYVSHILSIYRIICRAYLGLLNQCKLFKSTAMQ